MTGTPLNELPLAIFTTCMPLAAGAFIGIAIALFSGGNAPVAARRLDRMTAIPIVALAVGFLGAFCHLSTPANAVYALSGIGHSPLTNEIAVASLFALVAVVYWILGLAGKLSIRARKAWLAAISVLGVVLAVFTGLAYHVDTIPTWSSAWPVVEMLGYLLMSTIVGALVAALAGEGSAADGADGELSSDVAKRIAVVALCGLAATAVATVIHMVQTYAMASPLLSGAALVTMAVPYLVGEGAALVAALAAYLVGMKREKPVALYAVASVLLLIGVFLGRLAFYCIQLNVGL